MSLLAPRYLFTNTLPQIKTMIPPNTPMIAYKIMVENDDSPLLWGEDSWVGEGDSVVEKYTSSMSLTVTLLSTSALAVEVEPTSTDTARRIEVKFPLSTEDSSRPTSLEWACIAAASSSASEAVSVSSYPGTSVTGTQVSDITATLGEESVCSCLPLPFLLLLLLLLLKRAENESKFFSASFFAQSRYVTYAASIPMASAHDRSIASCALLSVKESQPFLTSMVKDCSNLIMFTGRGLIGARLFGAFVLSL